MTSTRLTRASSVFGTTLRFLLLLLLGMCTTPTTATTADETSFHSPLVTCSSSLSSSVEGVGTGVKDEMKHLPGFDQPLPSRWYSGYVDYELEGQQVHTHYVLIEAEDATDTTPIIYWSNGGPGASSLFGVLTELGPLLLSDESLRTEDYRNTGIPTPMYNPYSWNRLGHILMIDQPAPVGFSYCNDEPDSHSCGGIPWTDELASQNAYQALQQVLTKKFPCLQELPLYLTGESYGGIYIPTLARQVVTHMEDFPINLQGFAVGDGCLGVDTNICGGLAHGRGDVFQDFWHVVFMAGHHQIPLEDYQKVMKECLPHSDHPDFLQFTSQASQDSKCEAVLKKVTQEIGGLFEYALYDECTYRNGLLRQGLAEKGLGVFDMADVEGALNDYPCGGGPVMEAYLKLDAVKDAFHVSEATFFEVDNAEGDFDYTPTEPDLTSFYKQVVQEGKLKVLVYNGDTDPAITSFAAANWTSHMGFSEVEHWRPWTIDGCAQMGGYVTRYKGNFDFLTIRGAGHMVPTYKPAASFAFLKAWIQGENYPGFNPNDVDKCPSAANRVSVSPPNRVSSKQKDSHESHLRSATGTTYSTDKARV